MHSEGYGTFSVHLSVCVSVCLSVCLSVHLSVCLSVCMSVTLHFDTTGYKAAYQRKQPIGWKANYYRSCKFFKSYISYTAVRVHVHVIKKKDLYAHATGRGKNSARNIRFFDGALPLQKD